MFRACAALIAAADLNTWQADSVSAFTNANLDETVYIKYPDGFECPGYMLKVNKAYIDYVDPPFSG
jgi:hypothetical protein